MMQVPVRPNSNFPSLDSVASLVGEGGVLGRAGELPVVKASCDGESRGGSDGDAEHSLGADGGSRGGGRYPLVDEDCGGGAEGGSKRVETTAWWLAGVNKALSLLLSTSYRRCRVVAPLRAQSCLLLLTSVFVRKISPSPDLDGRQGGPNGLHVLASIVGVLVNSHTPVDLGGAEHLVLKVVTAPYDILAVIVIATSGGTVVISVIKADDVSQKAELGVELLGLGAI